MNDAVRPSMRRKSSAQNLLSSFKPQTTPVPPPLNLSASNISSSTAPSSYTAVSTPIATTPLPKPEWDSQSLQSETVASSLAGAQSPQLGGAGQGTPIECLRERAQRRILILTYIRNIHEGQSHWFHTIQLSRSDLERAYRNMSEKKRPYRYAILGLSLSTLLDIHHPQDLLRGLLNTITEYDLLEGGENPKNQNINKKVKRFKLKGKFTDTDASPCSTLLLYVLSFHLSLFTFVLKKLVSFTTLTVQFHAWPRVSAHILIKPALRTRLPGTLLSLLDVLSEVYSKISRLLGPSPLPQPPLGPLAGLVPRPGVSYIFAGDGATSINTKANGSYQSLSPTSSTGQQALGGYHTPYHHSNPNLPSIASTMSAAALADSFPGDANNNTSGANGHTPSIFSSSTGPSGSTAGSLWEVANGSSSGMMMHNVGLGGPPVNWTNTLGEMVTKIDGKLKKLIDQMLRDLEECARLALTNEVNSLETLLRTGDPAATTYARPIGSYGFDSN